MNDKPIETDAIRSMLRLAVADYTKALPALTRKAEAQLAAMIEGAKAKDTRIAALEELLRRLCKSLVEVPHASRMNFISEKIGDGVSVENRLGAALQDSLSAISAEPSNLRVVTVEEIQLKLASIRRTIPADVPRDQYINQLLCSIEDWLAAKIGSSADGEEAT